MRASQTARIAGGALMVAALIAGASPLEAQEAADGSWLPWTGCWIEVDAPADAPMTCVLPDEGGAALLTVTRAGVTERQMLRGDGADRAVDASGCVGLQATEFSSDGTRVYTRSRLSCDGGTERSTRGLMAMVAPAQWIQIRALTVGQGSVSWVKRYRPAPADRVEAAGLAELEAATGDRELAIQTARMAAAAAPSVDDIIDAHARTDSEAVRAWIVEHGTPIRLDADGLLRMADAGVSEAVIDVAVAVSYPDRFAVAREPDSRWDERDRWDRWDRRDRFGYGARRCGLSSYYDLFSSYDPFFGPGFGYGSVYRSAYGCGYSPYAGGRFYGSYGTGTVVVIRPAEGEAAPSGRAVKGRGYTGSGGGRKAASGSSSSLRPSDRSSARTGQGYTGSRGSSSSSSKGKAKPKGGGG